MPYIQTGDFNGDPQNIQTEANGDGTISPRYGLNDTALAAFTNLANKLDTLIAALNLTVPATDHVAVTPSDVTVMTGVRQIYVGGAGDVVATVNGVDATYTCQAGTTLTIAATKIKATGTTATGIVAQK